ncbi:MAG: DUF3604 domain-containing protein [Alphaproteobacteria bacterium]
MMRLIGKLAILVVLGFGVWVFAIFQGWFGELHDGGIVADGPRPPEVNIVRDAQTLVAAVSRGRLSDNQILFGDLHVHTTFSVDAFVGSLPIVQGEGAHPVSDACDFARFCSALDFWSITDHGIGLNERKWTDTKKVIRDCNAQAGDPDRPDMISFLGWEWTQIGTNPDNHYGHKNVILRQTADDLVPARPVGAYSPPGSIAHGGWKGVPAWQAVLMTMWAPGGDRKPYYGGVLFNQELADRDMCPEGVASPDLPPNCIELAAEPKDLFRKLDEWQTEAIVIPHGTTWGFYTPPGVSMDKQLKKGQSRPDYQMLVEIFSGHGNSDEYRDWRAISFDAAGNPSCPEPTEGYLPSCWRAGEIITDRCLAEGVDEAECASRAADARQYYVEAANAGFNVVPGAKSEDWLDAGQCQDCRLPAFNYRPGNSVQYALAISNFDEAGKPKRFTWGIMASSDNHQARPGTGYKEFGRYGMTEGVSLGGISNRLMPEKEPLSVPQPFDPTKSSIADFNITETERQGSFFMTGGLIAAHTEGRNRDAIWNAMQARKTYGTSGDRILLWFDLIDDNGAAVPMGSVVKKRSNPTFKVTALGAQVQRPGCPEYAMDQLGADEIARICKNECYNPGDTRKGVERLEVIRIRPQITQGEDVAGLIEDPWKVFECDVEESRVAGCQTTFTDEDYVRGGRDATYYVRVIEEAGPTVNAGMERCTRDANGRCITVNLCKGDPFRHDKEDDCLAPAEELAWSSPIFLNYD